MPKYLKFTLLCLLAAAILVWFGWSLNWSEVSGAIKRADTRYIAAAVALISLTYLVRAFRWRALLMPLAPETSLRDLFAATTVGFSAVFLIGRAGEVVRPAFLPLRERRVSPSASFVTIAVERLCDMASIVVMFAANLLIFQPPASSGGGEAIAFGRIRLAGLVVLLGALACLGGLIWFRGRADQVVGWLDTLFSRAPKFINRAGKILTGLLSQLARSLSILVDARELLVMVGWSALLWGLIIVATWLVYRAFGLTAGIGATVFVLGWSLVGSLVPTPGGAAGTYHAATVAGLIMLGLTRTPAEAAAVAIVLHLTVFAPALPFGLYYFLRSNVSVARLRKLATEDTDKLEDEKKGDAQIAFEQR